MTTRPQLLAARLALADALGAQLDDCLTCLLFDDCPSPSVLLVMPNARRAASSCCGLAHYSGFHGC